MRKLTLTQWMDILAVVLFCGIVSCAQESRKETSITESMINIPAGKFTLGVGEQVREMSLPAYFIDKTEVTNNAFEKFILSGGYEKKILDCRRLEFYQGK